jgi:hypothetical protein
LWNRTGLGLRNATLSLPLFDEFLQLARLLGTQLPQPIGRLSWLSWLNRLNRNGHSRLTWSHRRELRRNLRHSLRRRLRCRSCFHRDGSGFFVGGFVLGAEQAGDSCREKQGEAEIGNPVGSARFVRTEFGGGFVVEVIVGVVMAGGCIRVGVVRSAHGRRRCPTSGAKSMGAARSLAF